MTLVSITGTDLPYCEMNNNMGCIDTCFASFGLKTSSIMNNNMGCIDTHVNQQHRPKLHKMNNNMGCIDTRRNYTSINYTR